jgi:hypothetical protein
MVGAFWGKIHSFGKMVNGNSSIQVAVALEEDGYESASALVVTYENWKRVGSWARVALITCV